MGYYFLNFLVFPLGYVGTALIWYTIFMLWRKGPSTNDHMMLALGWLCIVTSDILQIIYFLAVGNWLQAFITSGWLTLILVFGWWKTPPKYKKKAKKFLGDKARATRARLVKKLKDARDRIRIPDPRGLRPVPLPS